MRTRTEACFEHVGTEEAIADPAAGGKSISSLLAQKVLFASVLTYTKDKMWANKKQSGFTIVEILIVIVVIGILAGIILVSYNGIQRRARDTKRSADSASILKSLEAYRTVNEVYPQETPTGGSGSFEQSNDTPGTFMEYLKGSYLSEVPVDPINDASHYYRYYVYALSSLTSYGCPLDRGELMVFYVIGFESSNNTPKSDDPLVCSSRTWGGGGTTYFKYKFEKD